MPRSRDKLPSPGYYPAAFSVHDRRDASSQSRIAKERSEAVAVNIASAGAESTMLAMSSPPMLTKSLRPASWRHHRGLLFFPMGTAYRWIVPGGSGEYDTIFATGL